MVTQTRLTLDEFLAMPDVDERRLELIDGEVYEKVSPRWGHSRLAGIICQLLNEFGYAGVEPRAVIAPRQDRGPSSPLPDVAFYRSDPPAEDDWMRSPPHVAVEIASPGQSRLEMRAKADMYVAFGVESVWVVYPQNRTIEVYESGTRRTLASGDFLTSPAVPGLEAPVDRVFDVLDEKKPGPKS